jgi:general secretion pathway protein G
MHLKRLAFTLIELLIVITILAVLLLIVIARVRNVTTRAREDALRDNLRQMQLAVTQFQNDVGGYPTSLTQLVMTRAQAASALPAEDATGQAIDPKGYHGPYFAPEKVPKDPFTEDGLFNYDPVTGKVSSLSDRLALDGTPYSSW